MEKPILSEANKQNSVAQHGAAPAPAAKRISNRASAKVAALLAAITGLSNASCGGSVETNGNIIMVEATDSGTPAPDAEPACSSMPNCPAVPVSIYNPSDPNADYYFQSDRWFRVNPETKEKYKVCEPFHKKECAPNQDPEKDDCSIPVCKNATTCDPIPARKSIDEPWRNPSRGNMPTTSENSNANPLEYLDSLINYPLLYDEAPDCAKGETPSSESYLTCDPIPTCKDTIPYCDPLPRCLPGQSPISCEESSKTTKYSYKADCENDKTNIINLFALQGLLINEVFDNADLCEKKHDSSLNEDYYQMPLISLNCRHVPECAANQRPEWTTATVNLDCGKWYSGTTAASSNTPSCDPIKSCNK